MEAKEFLVLNPLLHSDLGKYIWINDTCEEHRDAQFLFDYMLKEGIYINGFATDAKSLIGLKMYNKKIFDINTLDMKTSAVFYDPYFRSTDIEAEVGGGYRARVVDPKIQGDVVIWGAGMAGENAYKILHINEIGVRYFVDSNKKLEGTTKCGLPVRMPDELDGSTEEVTVIEALGQWKEVDDDISGKIKKRYHYSLDEPKWNQFTCDDNDIEKYIFELDQYWSFIFFEDRKVYVYGDGAVECEFVKYLELMDYDFEGFLVDDVECKSSDEYNGYPVKCIEEILYESNYYIWIYDARKAKKLKELGLVYFKNFIKNNFYWDITIERTNVLDANLGYNYLTGSKYPGIIVYGNEDESEYKIAIFGGSTTDGALYPFKSWPELLHKKLGSANIAIYNCGTYGYISSQELLKLIRDVLVLEPDMIVVYDGFNETYILDDRYPFVHGYLRTLFNYANSHVEVLHELIGDNRPKVCQGIVSRKDKFENWLSNIRLMHEIATAKGIIFYSFCQPMLSSKEGKSEKEKNILLSMPNSTIDKMIKASFREHMSQMQDRPDYMYDLSHIFDGQSDIYMDICHVWEKGNDIIAEEIKKVILPEICNLVTE